MNKYAWQIEEKYEKRAEFISTLWKLGLISNKRYAKMMIKESNKYDSRMAKIGA